MVSINESRASLRFLGDAFDPEMITRELRCQPTTFWRKGDPFSDGRTRQRDHWSLAAEDCSPENLDGQIKKLLTAVSDDPVVWSRLASLKPDIFIGLFLLAPNEGLVLTPESLAMVAARGITLDFDIYGPDDEEPT